VGLEGVAAGGVLDAPLVDYAQGLVIAARL
jgi:hypothetical protein